MFFRLTRVQGNQGCATIWIVKPCGTQSTGLKPEPEGSVQINERRQETQSHYYYRRG